MTSKGANRSLASHAAIRPNDVLLGRGSGPNRWMGNIRFRQLVLKCFQDYVDTLVSSSSQKEWGQDHKHPTSFSALDAHVKNQLASNVLLAIEAKNGRFLQKLTKEQYENESYPPSTIIHEEVEAGKGRDKVAFVYVEASRRKAMEKIKQTFRFLNDQKEERRFSKVEKAQTMSTEAVEAAFAAAPRRSSLTPAPINLDRMISSLEMHDLMSLRRTLVGNEAQSALIPPSLANTTVLPVYSYNQGRSAALQFQLTRNMMLAASLRTAQIKEEISMQQAVLHPFHFMSRREILDLTRRLATEANSVSSFINNNSSSRRIA